MFRLIATFISLATCGLAFAETGEVPMETVGTGGLVAFFVICLVLVVAFVWLTNKGSKQSSEERAGDKLK